jgi:hypothetical protein
VGAPVVTWVDPGSARAAAAAHVAHGTLSGGFGRAVRLGTPCRTANAATPVTLASRRLGVAWTDNARVDTFADFDEPRGGGLLHVGIPGTAPPQPDAPPPALSARVLGPAALRTGTPLRVQVRCRRGPCDVRAAARSFETDRHFLGDPLLTATSATLAEGRRTTLRLPVLPGSSFAPHGRPARATVAIVACGASGTVSRLVLHPRLRRLPPRPLPRVLDLTARRLRGGVRVTWRTSTPARFVTFSVQAEPFSPDAYAELPGRGRSHFAVTLHHVDARRLRRVAVTVGSSELPNGPTTTVRIR